MRMMTNGYSPAVTNNRRKYCGDRQFGDGEWLEVSAATTRLVVAV